MANEKTAATKKTPASSKKTARKTSSKKSASKKKTAKKKSAGKKSTVKKSSPATAARQADSHLTLQKIDPEHRRRMIAETAYFIAEQRGFVAGAPLDDWLQAEVLVDRLLESGEA